MGERVLDAPASLGTVFSMVVQDKTNSLLKFLGTFLYGIPVNVHLSLSFMIRIFLSISGTCSLGAARFKSAPPSSLILAFNGPNSLSLIMCFISFPWIL